MADLIRDIIEPEMAALRIAMYHKLIPEEK